MEKTNVKCPVCGYVFETEEKKIEYYCPLCSSEYDFESAKELLTETEQTNSAKESKPFGTKLLEWAVFFGSFSAFIIILYYIIDYIVSK